MRVDTLTSAIILVPLVAGHGAVTSYTIGNTKYPGYEGFAPATSPETIQFQWPDYNPTMTVSDAKMRCNGGDSAKLSAPITAGQNITAVWSQWTHKQGPVMVWLYKCSGDFSSCNGDGKGGSRSTRWVCLEISLPRTIGALPLLSTSSSGRVPSPPIWRPGIISFAMSCLLFTNPIHHSSMRSVPSS